MWPQLLRDVKKISNLLFYWLMVLLPLRICDFGFILFLLTSLWNPLKGLFFNIYFCGTRIENWSEYITNSIEPFCDFFLFLQIPQISPFHNPMPSPHSNHSFSPLPLFRSVTLSSIPSRRSFCPPGTFCVILLYPPFHQGASSRCFWLVRSQWLTPPRRCAPNLTDFMKQLLLNLKRAWIICFKMWSPKE